MRIFLIIAKVFFILCIPVVLLSGSIAWGFNSLWIYEYGFQKSDVSRISGLSEAELEQVGKTMIDYFNSSEEYVEVSITRDGRPLQLFTVDEQIHLKDVKHLVRLDYRIFQVSLVVFLGYLGTMIFWRRGVYRRQAAWSVILGGGLSLLLILVMAIGTLINFDQLFLQFHFLAFTNDLWSVPGYMVTLFGGLWYDAVLIGTGFMAGLAIVLMVFSGVYLVISSRKLPAARRIPDNP